jgi:RNA polymerase sigma-54 factor
MVDIIKEINTIIENNPVLEETERYDEFNYEFDENSYLKEKLMQQEQNLEREDGREISYAKNLNNEDVNYENFIARPLTLEEHLMFQLGITGLDNFSKTIGEYIIGNLDQNGYFRLDINEVAEELNISSDKIIEVLKIIQEFEPAGIASRNLRECIIIQLKDMKISDVVIKDIEDILSMLNDTEMDLQEILYNKKFNSEYCAYLLNILKKIDPKPGLKYSESVKYIYPDVYIQNQSGRFNIFINERDLPTLEISNYYINMLKQKELDATTKIYIEEKIKNAEWVIKSLKLRKQAILKVTEAIVEFQKDFFLKGFDYLKPMRLKDISNKTELHESTISRVTSGKYAFKEYGLIELKILFKKGYDTVDGALSVDNIKKLIVTLINEEPTENPYSDKKISDFLCKKGIQIARRTVTKYREELKIPSKILRKKEK